MEVGWSWYSVDTGDVVDAQEDPELPTSLWREAVVSKLGILEAVMLINGTVQRRTPEGWRDIGTIQLAAEGGEAAFAASVAAQPSQPRQYLLGAARDFGAYAVDVVRADATEPKAFPPAADLMAPEGVTPPKSEAELAAWVLRQCLARETSALVHITADGSAPVPLFAHPFADVTANGVWLDPSSEVPEAVMVEDLRPKVYALTSANAELLQSLSRGLPAKVLLGAVSLSTEGMEPMIVERHGERWLCYFSHPALSEAVVLPAFKKADSKSTVDWLGDRVLPARGGALNGAAATLQPQVESHRLRVGSSDVPVYLILPPGGAAALTVRLHEGPNQRDRWGADGMDAWLISRGYGVLKVNFRGSAGFGRRWRTGRTGSGDVAEEGGADDLTQLLMGRQSSTDGVVAVKEHEEAEGFLDDIAAAVRWALEERKVLGGIPAPGSLPPVAVLGSYFGGYAALHAAHRLKDLIACAVAVAPVQRPPAGSWWPESYVPDAATRASAASLRSGAEAGGIDPAREVFEPAAMAKELREAALMLVEFERDGPDAQGDLMESLAPLGCDPEEWPTSVQYVQYAGEGRGGGMVKQSMLDMYRRLDGFLYRHLSPLAAATDGRSLLHESFVEEGPFISASLLPAMRGGMSASAKNIELGFEQGLRTSYGDQVAASLPQLRSAAGGFGEGKESGKAGKRKALLAPSNRIAVRQDGTIEVTVVFAEEPEGLHVLLSEVWVHLRSKGMGFTLALPRQPKKGQAIRAFRLPSGRGFVFEIAGESSIGAIENYNGWAASSGRATVISMLKPEDLSRAPVMVPATIVLDA
ncbi:unnamed protein product [Polarella glacialis]|uniref:Peptidase S9 prolyl oligopeptidase catalytic domain-containing protein n=1 Tax=Polarella glacialis TaxID=89957 RepID=A0A813HI71_POLGL|nr:unnamed protein product [Polarella glacialis]